MTALKRDKDNRILLKRRNFRKKKIAKYCFFKCIEYFCIGFKEEAFGQCFPCFIMNMKTTSTYIRLLQKFMQLHASEYGITRIGIFGSAARGEQTNESDIDIYFETDKKLSLFRMGGLMYDLKELFGVPVDIVHNTERLPAILKQQIEKEIIYV